MKPLQPFPHGILDYAVGIILLLAPGLFGFADNAPQAANIMTFIGILALGLSLLTNYPLGLIKAIPFPVHGVIETIGAGALLVSPWLFGYAAVESARWLAVIVGVGWLIVVALTNYRSQVAHRGI